MRWVPQRQLRQLHLINYDSTGGIGGGEVGYNWQSGNYMVGIEADDGFWSGIKGSDELRSMPRAPSDHLDRRGPTFAGVARFRARGGIAVDRLLLFFTGGWAYGDLLHTNTDSRSIGADQFTGARQRRPDRRRRHRLRDHQQRDRQQGGISLYYNFNAYSRPGLPTFTPNGQFPYTVNSTYSVVTVGLDYKFGGGACGREVLTLASP